ncbi:four-carbon acid sugar kinase family protein [Nocardioides sediminis]|uniref:four-carbon acid sugar kinase family protein n=1 Tax=Nocardioides sediminis TaxID=433648 RepID=UPI000D322B8E|nr:four-carbon acid sugar kinase family protein [Nocardioides sediminis]
MRVLVLADDLTGASDTVVQFAHSGWSSLLSLSGGWREEPTEDAVALTLDTRRDPQAERITARATADLATGAVYLKIDSTVRGRVAEQVRGALTGVRRRRPAAYAVVCPAYPALGRTVVDGVVLVDGTPVHEGAAGRDPVTPVTESDLTRLLPGSVRIPATDGPVSGLEAALREAGTSHDVVVVDARDDADVERLAAAVAAIGPDALPVGSAGLAGALARAWSEGTHRAGAPTTPPVPTGRALVVVSSLHEVARAQARALGETAEAGTVDVLLTPDRPEHGAAETRAHDIAAQASAILDRGEHDLLVLVGGDGAAATLNVLGAAGIRVADAPVEGVPLGTIVGGRHDGLAVATKAGGFGDPTTLIRLFTAVRALGAPS